ncbi:MAG: glycoside hydrolase family 16 protein [Cyclobacteriaceae bacterium]
MKLTLSIFYTLLMVTLIACGSDGDLVEDDIMDNANVLSDLQVTVNIEGKDANNPHGDGSGIVDISASAINATTYQFVHNGQIFAVPAGSKTFTFETSGTHTYSITVIAIGEENTTIEETVTFDVLFEYTPSADLITMLTGDSSKEWRIKFEKSGHLGSGHADEQTPNLWSAKAYEKEDLGAYDDRFSFNVDGTFTHTTNGNIHGKSGPMSLDLGGDQGLTPNSNAEFENYPHNNYSESWTLSMVDGEETLAFSNVGFHGYYVGGDHLYTIIFRSHSELSISTIGSDGLKWFGILTTDEVPDKTDLPPNSIYSSLVWSDEFDVDGAPDPLNWGYDLGDHGWGNNELQNYTNNLENASVEDGVLTITARKNGNGYTSARLKSQGLRSFKYGRIEVRAKLPSSQGTWPAIWMLGSNFTDVGWPNCGEMDIMEQTGWEKNQVLGTFHWQDPASDSYRHAGQNTIASTSTTEFHLYSLEWTPEVIYVLYDNESYVTFPNNSNLPFNADFFIILNIAIGGNLGGEVDPVFTQDMMEIDYVRVYQ